MRTRTRTFVVLLVGWGGLTALQFLVFMNRMPFCSGDCGRRDLAGMDSPVPLPAQVSRALWDIAPVVLAPTRNVVYVAARGPGPYDTSADWVLGRGWRGMVRRLAFPFPPPPGSEIQDEAYRRLSRRTEQINALWFAALNSLVWIVGIAGATRLARHVRRRRQRSSESRDLGGDVAHPAEGNQGEG